MKLNPKCKSSLIDNLEKSLAQIQVTNNIYLQVDTIEKLQKLDNILPKSGVLRNSLSSWIDEYPLLIFVLEELKLKLSLATEYNVNENNENLFDILKDTNPKKLAKELIDNFESLPRPYKLFLKLSDKFKDLIKFYGNVIFITPRIRIVLINDTFLTENKINSTTRDSFEGLLKFKFADIFANNNYFENNKVYLEINAEGYIAQSSTTETLGNSLDSVKYILGLGLAIGLFSYEVPSYKQDANYITSFNKIDKNWNFQSTKVLPDDLNDYVSRIIINEKPMGKKQNFNRDNLDYYIKQITKVLSNSNKYSKLLNACKWFYEGRVGDNQLLSFIQNTVVLEILLGDKLISDKIGIGELLRNRCAYFISNSDKDREAILNDFKEIYDVRSKIVHSGKSKLNSNEIVLLRKLRFLCSKVIHKELSLIN